ncbi:MAG: restriction endonuclease subunit S [Oscillospiraceae bacterium]
MKSEWKECSIADLGEVVGGATPSTKNPDNYANGNISWITPKDLSTHTGRYICKGERNITEKGLNSCSTRLLPVNSVLFSSRAPIGYVAIAGQELCTNQGFKSVVPNSATDYMFLYYLLEYNKENIENMGSGTTFKEVSGNTMKSIKVSVPVNIDEQKRIASVLSVIDDKIELNNEINKNLEQQAQAIFKAWFVDFEPFGGAMPDDWSECILDSMCSMIIKGITPKYIEHSDQFVINQKCVRNHQIDLSLARCHEPKKVNEKWLQYGDIVVNSTGTGTLGRAAQVLFTPNNMTVDSHVTIIRASKQEYIYYLGLWATSHEHDFEMLQTGSTGQTDLPRERLKQMPVILPSDDILCKFSEIIKPIAEIRIKNQQENQSLAALRDTLLPKLMNGEIDVSAVKI